MIEALGWRFASWTPAFLELYWNQIGCEHDEVNGDLRLASTSPNIVPF